jgi:S1-C subfamily serine protease
MMSQLALQAQWVAVNDNSGQLRGVAVVSILPDSMLERLGLQSNDVVTSIQGVAVDSSGAALNTARGLDLSQPVTLGIERRGVATTVVVNLQHH